MKIIDNGPNPNVMAIEQASIANENFRTVAWSGKYLQVVLMSIPVGESIGLEVHPETDQFLRIYAGKGKCVMGSTKENLDFEQEVSDGWSIQVPAGKWHNVTNIGDEPLKIYTVYAPVHHGAGVVQETKADAERDSAAGTNVPPSWSVQP